MANSIDERLAGGRRGTLPGDDTPLPIRNRVATLGSLRELPGSSTSQPLSSRQPSLRRRTTLGALRDIFSRLKLKLTGKSPAPPEPSPIQRPSRSQSEDFYTSLRRRQLDQALPPSNWPHSRSGKLRGTSPAPKPSGTASAISQTPPPPSMAYQPRGTSEADPRSIDNEPSAPKPSLGSSAMVQHDAKAEDEQLAVEPPSIKHHVSAAQNALADRAAALDPDFENLPAGKRRGTANEKLAAWHTTLAVDPYNKAVADPRRFAEYKKQMILGRNAYADQGAVDLDNAKVRDAYIGKMPDPPRLHISERDGTKLQLEVQATHQELAKPQINGTGLGQGPIRQGKDNLCYLLAPMEAMRQSRRGQAFLDQHIDFGKPQTPHAVIKFRDTVVKLPKRLPAQNRYGAAQNDPHAELLLRAMDVNEHYNLGSNSLGIRRSRGGEVTEFFHSFGIPTKTYGGAGIMEDARKASLTPAGYLAVQIMSAKASGQAMVLNTETIHGGGHDVAVLGLTDGGENVLIKDPMENKPNKVPLKVIAERLAKGSTLTVTDLPAPQAQQPKPPASGLKDQWPNQLSDEDIKVSGVEESPSPSPLNDNLNDQGDGGNDEYIGDNDIEDDEIKNESDIKEELDVNDEDELSTDWNSNKSETINKVEAIDKDLEIKQDYDLDKNEHAKEDSILSVDSNDALETDALRRAHRRDKAESLNRSRLSANVRQLFGDTSIYRGWRGIDQSGSSRPGAHVDPAKGGLRPGTKLKRLIDARAALDSLAWGASNSRYAPLWKQARLRQDQRDPQDFDNEQTVPWMRDLARQETELANRAAATASTAELLASSGGNPDKLDTLALRRRQQALSALIEHQDKMLDRVRARADELRNSGHDPGNRAKALDAASDQMASNMARAQPSLQRELAEIERLLALADTLAENGIREDGLKQLRSAVEARIGQVSGSQDALHWQTPPSNLRRALLVDLPQLYQTLGVGSMTPHERNQRLNTLSSGGMDADQATRDGATRAKQILERLAAHGIDTHAAPAEMLRALDGRLDERERVQDLGDAASSLRGIDDLRERSNKLSTEASSLRQRADQLEAQARAIRQQHQILPALRKQPKALTDEERALLAEGITEQERSSDDPLVLTGYANKLDAYAKQLRLDAAKADAQASTLSQRLARLQPAAQRLRAHALRQTGALAAAQGKPLGDAAADFHSAAYGDPLEDDKPLRERLFHGDAKQRMTALDSIDDQLHELSALEDSPRRLALDITKSQAKEKVCRDVIGQLEDELARIRDDRKHYNRIFGRNLMDTRVEKLQQKLRLYDGRLRDAQAETKRLGAIRESRLAELNTAHLQQTLNTPDHSNTALAEELDRHFASLRTGLGVREKPPTTAQELGQALKKDLAWPFRKIKSKLQTWFGRGHDTGRYSGEARDTAKAFSKAIQSYQEAPAQDGRLDHATSDRLSAVRTQVDVIQNTFGVLKSLDGIGTTLATGSQSKPVARGRETPDDPIEMQRQAPYRLLAARRDELPDYVSGWTRADLLAGAAGAYRFAAEDVLRGYQDAQILDPKNRAANQVLNSPTTAQMKLASQALGAGLATYAAVKGGKQAWTASKLRRTRSKALAKAGASSGAGGNPNALADLKAVDRLASQQQGAIEKWLGAAKDTVNAGAFSVGTAAAAGAGKLSLANPITASIAAGLAVTYSSAKHIYDYNKSELRALHQDAMAGRVSQAYAQQLEQEAAQADFGNPIDYLDHLLLQKDTKYATERLVMNLKQEMRGGATDKADSDKVARQRVQERIQAQPKQLQRSKISNDPTQAISRIADPLGIYGGDDDERRIAASPTATFLRETGMSAAEILALADSADDKATTEACRQLIQLHLKLKG